MVLARASRRCLYLGATASVSLRSHAHGIRTTPTDVQRRQRRDRLSDSHGQLPGSVHAAHRQRAEGSYYTVLNPTQATAITGHAAPAIADGCTKPIIHLFNPTTAKTDVFIDYIRIQPVVVNGSSTATDFTVYIDSLAATARTGGGAANTPGSCLGGGGACSAVVYTGAVTAVSAAAVKIFAWMIRPVIAVTLDQYVISLPAATVLTGTNVASVACSGPPICIPPGGNFMFSQIGPSGTSTAMTFEYEMGFFER